MNMPTEKHEFLDDYINAAREVDEAALGAAVADFRARLPGVKPARKSIPAWLRYSGAVALLVLAIGIVPTFLPNQPGNQAFAQVQAWFEDYQTMQADISMRQGAQQVSEVKVWSLANGATRVEVPPIVHIVDPQRNVMHTLLPGGQVMSQEIGPGVAANAGESHLGWLDEIRDFQGIADVLDESRTIDEIDALGWQLNLEGQSHTLWVDPADNRPLLMEAELPGGLSMAVQFRFNQVLPPRLFEAPGS